MKFVDDYRDPKAARKLSAAIAGLVSRPWTLMEVCGGQTHSIVRYGIDRLLPLAVDLVHGPGCPVCVTPEPYIVKAIEIAQRPDTILCSFGDMLRVPSKEGDLLAAKAKGAEIRVVYSPMDALQIAKDNPNQQVVFLAVGFETTAPANAMAVYRAAQEGVENFSLLVSHVLVPPAIEALLQSPENRVQGFLAAGHVCTVMGWKEYEPLAKKYGVPIVVTGFEPVDILEGVYLCLRQLEEGRTEVENQYARVVRREGNRPAQEIIGHVFKTVSRNWRGMGEIPASGLALADAYAGYDAERRFGPALEDETAHTACISGTVLRGEKKPPECPAFGTACTPENPLGVTMVSSEGACAAYYRYRGAQTREEAGA